MPPAPSRTAVLIYCGSLAAAVALTIGLAFLTRPTPALPPGGAGEKDGAKYHVTTLATSGAIHTLRVNTATGASTLSYGTLDPSYELPPPPGAEPGPPGRYEGNLSAVLGTVPVTVSDRNTGRSWITGDLGKTWLQR